jgi:hypothetical protein
MYLIKKDEIKDHKIRSYYETQLFELVSFFVNMNEKYKVERELRVPDIMTRYLEYSRSITRLQTRIECLFAVIGKLVRGLVGK